MTLSVVVATRDRPQLLEGCLLSLGNAMSPDDELIVVDSASTSDATRDIAEARNAQVIRCSRPGTSHARNVGWRAASGTWVAFVDDDVRVDPSWAKAIRAAAEESPRLSFLTGRLRLAQEADRPVAVFDADHPIPIDRTAVGDVGHGANFAARRDALETVGGYHELLGPGARWRAGEDLALIDRLIARGFDGRYEPSVSAYHVQWRSPRDLFGLEWRYGLGQGARLVLLRKLDRERFLAVAKKTTFDSGVLELYRSIVRGWKRSALRAVIRLTGTAVGYVGMALTRPGEQPATCRQD